MEIIIGIDQSLTGTGVIVMGDNKMLHHCVIPSAKVDGDYYQRVHNITTELMTIVRKYKPTSGRIEGIAMGAKGMIGDLGGLQHVIVNHIMFGEGIPMVVIPPKSLKKACSGNGNATKWMMFDALPAHVQNVFVDNYKFSKRENKTIAGNGFDVTDAYHLATVEI